jgi:hypothetical protein
VGGAGLLGLQCGIDPGHRCIWPIATGADQTYFVGTEMGDGRFAATNDELFSDLYAQLFQWSNEYEDDSVTGRIQHVLGYDHPLLNQYIVLRTRMEMAIHREMELLALRLQP